MFNYRVYKGKQSNFESGFTLLLMVDLLKIPVEEGDRSREYCPVAFAAAATNKTS